MSMLKLTATTSRLTSTSDNSFFKSVKTEYFFFFYHIIFVSFKKSPPLPGVECKEKETPAPLHSMLTVHRLANTTQPSPPSPLQASLSTLLPTPIPRNETTIPRQPVSASAPLLVIRSHQRKIPLISDRKKKTSIACPAFITTLPAVGKELCLLRMELLQHLDAAPGGLL